MDFPEFKDLVKRIAVGKQLPDSVYVHESALHTVPESLASLTLRVASALKVNDDSWNIIKFNKRDFKVTFLHYPEFETYAYPPLKLSTTVDLQKLSSRIGNYSGSDNPPILHRKETFVTTDYPLHEEFCSSTQEGEAIGLYENTRAIGFKQNWERLIKNKGYKLDENGRLHKQEKLEKANSIILPEGSIDRHKTAIDRNSLSQPMQALARHNYFNGDYSILDYGCGKGDDLRELEAHGIDASGWDPVHRSEGTLVNSDIVNLGFVLNVIEDKPERDETLKRAWGYTDKLLIVSVMIAGDRHIEQFQPYKDGIVTTRNTFQKYYSQGEFRNYIEETAGENAIAVGQGIFIIFKDKIEEQLFLVERQHIRRAWKQKTQREIKQHTPKIKKDLIDKHLSLFTDFWEASLDLGRIPANSEFEFSDQIRRVAGSHNKAHNALLEHFGTKLFEEAKQKRREDLLVYFSLAQFEKRKAQNKMPDSLKRDLKAFFNSYNSAIDEAKELLFSVGDPYTIEKACNKAYEDIGCGELADGHSFTFHKDYLGDIPPELRVYIGCATQLYGDTDDMHLIKAHIRSGKVSLMRYEKWESETPMLIERIKIKLRELDVDFFDYVGEFKPAPLLNRHIFK
jgi:DNA phosphorothioation-associated putative methyltransferase